MGAARVTISEIKRAIKAAQDCGVVSGAVESDGLRIEFSLVENTKNSKPLNEWDDDLGFNSSK